MWSSDFPPSETTYPNSLAVIARDSVGVAEQDIRRVGGGCAGRGALTLPRDVTQPPTHPPEI